MADQNLRIMLRRGGTHSNYSIFDFGNRARRRRLRECLVFSSLQFSLLVAKKTIMPGICRESFYLTTLFTSIAAACLPMTLFALAQLPLSFDLIWAIFKKVPQHSYKVISD
ncbi:hypothetical protein WN943_029675 [Citrus x changshan-huyou]